MIYLIRLEYKFSGEILFPLYDKRIAMCSRKKVDVMSCYQLLLLNEQACCLTHPPQLQSLMQPRLILQREQNKIIESVIIVGNQDIPETHAGNFMVVQCTVKVEKGLVAHFLELTCLKLLMLN